MGLSVVFVGVSYSTKQDKPCAHISHKHTLSETTLGDLVCTTVKTLQPSNFKVARLDFLGGIPPKFEH